LKAGVLCGEGLPPPRHEEAHAQLLKPPASKDLPENLTRPFGCVVCRLFGHGPTGRLVELRKRERRAASLLLLRNLQGAWERSKALP